MYIAVGILSAFILGIVVFARVAELQTTISLVINRGGIWARYETGIGGKPVVGFQVRLMTGRKPRAWMRSALKRRPVRADYSKTIRSIFEPKWKPLQLPIKGALDLGTNLWIKELNVKAVVGLEDDAAFTALLCGSANAALQTLRAVATRGQYVPKGNIVVLPSFSQNKLAIRLKCILAIKVRHIIREIVEGILRRHHDGQSSD